VIGCVTRRATGRGLGTTASSGQWQQLCTVRGARVCNWRVRSLMGPACPVTHLGEQCGGKFDRTRWRVRSHATGRVRSTKSLSGPLLDSNRTPSVTRLVSHDWTRPVDKVALRNLSGQRPDAGTVVSGRGMEHVRSHVT
jgi:hypothetical protein